MAAVQDAANTVISPVTGEESHQPVQKLPSAVCQATSCGLWLPDYLPFVLAKGR